MVDFNSPAPALSCAVIPKSSRFDKSVLQIATGSPAETMVKLPFSSTSSAVNVTYSVPPPPPELLPVPDEIHSKRFSDAKDTRRASAVSPPLR